MKTPWRWVIPIGGGLLSAILIVVGTPHVTWYLRAALALIAFLYISGPVGRLSLVESRRSGT